MSFWQFCTNSITTKLNVICNIFIGFYKIKINISYWSGYYMHRKELKKNALLYKWVTQENFLGDNGNLPNFINNNKV